MSKDRLVYDESIHAERDYRHQLVWWIAEDQDYGGVLGDTVEYADDDLAIATGDEREIILACLTASKTDGVEHDSHGYHWPTKAKANAALRAIRAAIKMDTGAPWPDWAIKAQAAGWKAPKGWKP